MLFVLQLVASMEPATLPPNVCHWVDLLLELVLLLLVSVVCSASPAGQLGARTIPTLSFLHIPQAQIKILASTQSARATLLSAS